MKYTWKEALCEARNYHKKKMVMRFTDGIDYDEDGKVFDSFPPIVKDALQYLYESDELD